MDYSNDKDIRRIRRVMVIFGLIWIVLVSASIYLSMLAATITLAILFALIGLMISLLDLQFVKIGIEKGSMVVRYYSFFYGFRKYRTFEFPIGRLQKMEVRKQYFGIKWEIRFTVRLKNRLADYPWVSLSAIPFTKRSKLVAALKELTS